MEELVKQFNEKYPIGSKVMWRSMNHPEFEHKEYEVRASAYLMSGQPVAFLKGKAGCVSIEPEFLKWD